MSDSIDKQIATILGWKTCKAPVDQKGQRTHYGVGHPEYSEAIARSNIFGVSAPDIYPYEKISSGYCDKWFKSEEEALNWAVSNLDFSSSLDSAMTLFDGTGITVCLGKPPEEDEHYSAYLTDHPVEFSSNLYSVSSSWAESVCICWLKYKVEIES